MRVYIAGPYSSAPEANVRIAMAMAHALMDAGHYPYCPHLSYFLELARPRPYAEWMALDLEWLALCEAVLRLPGPSPGADVETARAQE